MKFRVQSKYDPRVSYRLLDGIILGLSKAKRLFLLWIMGHFKWYRPHLRHNDIEVFWASNRLLVLRDRVQINQTKGVLLALGNVGQHSIASARSSDQEGQCEVEEEEECSSWSIRTPRLFLWRDRDFHIHIRLFMILIEA